MTGKELENILRNDILDDVQIPYLWSTTELLRGLNYAEVQACRRSHLIIDGSTANDSGTAAIASTAGQQPLCQLSLVAGKSVYSLNSKILMVKRCQLSGMSYPLAGPLTYNEADEQLPGWMGTSGTVGTASSGGYPSAFLNEPSNTITFLMAPVETGTAFMVVSRLPLLPFTLLTSPEIPERYHEGLLDWAAHLAYMKNDSDTFNPQKAKYYEDKFTSQFGALPNAKSERLVRSMQMNARMRPVRFGY
jgi:hypothetical protein